MYVLVRGEIMKQQIMLSNTNNKNNNNNNRRTWQLMTLVMAYKAISLAFKGNIIQYM